MEDHPGLICEEDGCSCNCLEDCSRCRKRYCEEHLSQECHFCVIEEDLSNPGDNNVHDEDKSNIQIDNIKEMNGNGDAMSSDGKSRDDPNAHVLGQVHHIQKEGDNCSNHIDLTDTEVNLEDSSGLGLRELEVLETSIGPLCVNRIIDGVDLLMPKGRLLDKAGADAIIVYAGMRSSGLLFVYGDQSVLSNCSDPTDEEFQRVFLGATCKGKTSKKIICHFRQMKYCNSERLCEEVRALDQCERWDMRHALTSFDNCGNKGDTFNRLCAGFSKGYFTPTADLNKLTITQYAPARDSLSKSRAAILKEKADRLAEEEQEKAAAIAEEAEKKRKRQADMRKQQELDDAITSQRKAAELDRLAKLESKRLQMAERRRKEKESAQTAKFNEEALEREQQRKQWEKEEREYEERRRQRQSADVPPRPNHVAAVPYAPAPAQLDLAQLRSEIARSIGESLNEIKTALSMATPDRPPQQPYPAFQQCQSYTAYSPSPPYPGISPSQPCPSSYQYQPYPGHYQYQPIVSKPTTFTREAMEAYTSDLQLKDYEYLLEEAEEKRKADAAKRHRIEKAAMRDKFIGGKYGM